MPFLLTVRLAADDGHQTPIRQAKVTAYALEQPVVLKSDGSQIVHQPETALTNDTGHATLTLYRGSEVLTPSDWAVTIDGVTWSGPVPESPDTASSILEMVESHGWGIIAAPKSAPVVAITGPVGATGPTGPTGPAIDGLSSDLAHGIDVLGAVHSQTHPVALLDATQEADSFNLTGPQLPVPPDQPDGGSPLSLDIPAVGSDDGFGGATGGVRRFMQKLHVGQAGGTLTDVTFYAKPSAAIQALDPAITTVGEIELRIIPDLAGVPDWENYQTGWRAFYARKSGGVDAAGAGALPYGVWSAINGESAVGFGGASNPSPIKLVPNTDVWIGVKLTSSTYTDATNTVAAAMPPLLIDASATTVETFDTTVDADYPPVHITDGPENTMRYALIVTPVTPPALEWTPDGGLIVKKLAVIEAVPSPGINIQNLGAVPDDATDCTTVLIDAFALSQQLKKPVYIPAGRYRVANPGVVIDEGSPGVYGDGIGRSILTTPPGLVIGSERQVFQVLGSDVTLRDVTFAFGSGITGSGQLHAAWVGAYRPRLERLEVSGAWGDGSGSGFGAIAILGFAAGGGDTFTLLTAITATGTPVEVTPSSMEGIVVGAGIVIQDGDPWDSTIVESVTSTTFTATFAATHAIGLTGLTWGDGMMQAVVEDCWIHDCPGQTGLFVGASGSSFRNNRIQRVGSGSTQHGIYAQGGYNHYEHNRVERASGFSFHGYKMESGIDASGDVWIGNESIDPGFAHMIVQGENADTNNPVNPFYAAGFPLTRSVILTGNTFRQTKGTAEPIYYGLNFHVPAILMGNVFEDVDLDAEVAGQFIGNLGIQVNRVGPPTASGAGLAASVKLGNVGITSL